MAVAGKVAITLATENGGKWSANVTYDRLVAVKHNNNLYISRKTVANVEPPNDEFWFLALEGFSGDDIEDIIDGSTQVGNAKTLDGHGAEYFAPKADLANYLPLTGGMIAGDGDANLDVKSNTKNHSYIAFYGKDGVLGRIGCSGGNTPAFYKKDWSSVYPLLHTGNMAEHVLPKTGGTVANATFGEALKVKRTAALDSVTTYENSDGVLGYIGMGNTEKPIYTDKTKANTYELLHTGNKPTGTYTGNGDATQRTINVGVGVGVPALLIVAWERIVIAYIYGAVGFNVGTKTTEYFTYDKVKYDHTTGILTLATDSDMVNLSNETFTYGRL